ARVLEKLPDYDASLASLPTYQDRLINRACADQFRREGAVKRGKSRLRHSLSRPNRHGNTLHDVLDTAHQDRVRGRRKRSDSELADLALDLATAAASLDADQQQLVEQIKQKSVPEVAEELNVVRGTVYRRLGPVREAFENSGLADYLD